MSKRLFMLMLTTGWFSGVVCIILVYTTRSELPEVLRAYLHTRHSSLSPGASAVYFLVSLALLIAGIVAIIGVYGWRPWARTIYTFVAFFNYCMLLPLGSTPTVHMYWVDITTGLATLFTGMTICAMWFVPEIQHRFQRSPKTKECPTVACGGV